jgi:hypothetical protein
MAEQLLPVDYLEDWEHMDGIEDVRFLFGPDRDSSGLVLPASSKMRRTSPNQADINYGVGFGWEATGQFAVLFVETLKDSLNALRIIPHSGDRILAFDCEWVIGSVKLVADQTQWKLFLQQSVKTPRDFLEPVELVIDGGIGSAISDMIIESTFIVR